MKTLPLELKQEIVLYINFLKCAELFPMIARYIYDQKKYKKLQKNYKKKYKKLQKNYKKITKKI